MAWMFYQRHSVTHNVLLFRVKKNCGRKMYSGVLLSFPFPYLHTLKVIKPVQAGKDKADDEILKHKR